VTRSGPDASHSGCTSGSGREQADHSLARHTRCTDAPEFSPATDGLLGSSQVNAASARMVTKVDQTMMVGMG